MQDPEDEEEQVYDDARILRLSEEQEEEYLRQQEVNRALESEIDEGYDLGEQQEDLLRRYSDLSDEEVVALCHEGEKLAEEYLLDKYKNFVRSKARSYFLIGADHEDIVQEGMIGLYKAIRDFRPERLSSFHAFAELCITRQIITAIKTATRQKHIPLNSYISLNKPLYDEESDRTLMDVIMEGRVSNPEEIIINREDLVNINYKIKEVLSGLEQDVLNAYLDGKSYVEIAESLGRHVKSIDNALQRVKRKLEKYLEEEE
ncbi:MAG: RNA polymerase sporulation sigma factor SigH [Clostridia bacterium]|nr:RNA polymerase sporulation sigma factor SigH [Clostridia bacterium]